LLCDVGRRIAVCIGFFIAVFFDDGVVGGGSALLVHDDDVTPAPKQEH